LKQAGQEEGGTPFHLDIALAGEAKKESGEKAQRAANMKVEQKSECLVEKKGR